MAAFFQLFKLKKWTLHVILKGSFVYLTGLSRQRGILGNTEATWGSRPSFWHRQLNVPKRQSTRQC